MQHPLKKLAICASLSVLLVGASLAYSKAAALSGQSRFVVSDCANDRVTLHFTSDALPAPLLIRTGDIVAKGAKPTEAAIAASITWDKPTVSESATHEFEATGKVTGPCPDPGSYQVPLRIVHDANHVESLEFELLRRAQPVLDAPTTITVPVWRTPLVGARELELTPLQLREASHSGEIESLSASGGELKDAAGQGTGILLNPTAQLIRIGPGEGQALALKLSEMPSPGTYSTRLTLYSPAIKANQTTDIIFKVRDRLQFLGLIVFAGVVLGWIVNGVLAVRSALRAAQLEALPTVNAMIRDAGAQRDPAVQQHMLQIATALEAAIRNATSSQAITEAIAEKQRQLTEVRTVAAQSAATLQTRLVATRAVLVPDSRTLSGAVRNALLGLFESLAAIEEMERSGDVEEALRRLDEFNAVLGSSVIDVLQAFISQVNDALNAVGRWSTPADRFETQRQSLFGECQAAFSKTTPTPLVASADDLARHLERLLALDAPDQISTAFRDAASTLDKGGKGELATALRVEADRVSQRVLRDTDPVTELRSLAATRERVSSLLLGADPRNPILVARLRDGDFPGAATLIVPTGTALAARVSLATPEPPAARTLTAPKRPLVAPRILFPGSLRVNELTKISLDWRGQTHPDDVEPGWNIQPCNSVELDRSKLKNAIALDVTPKVPGFLEVSFGSTLLQVNVMAMMFAGDIAAVPDFERFRQERRRDDWWIGAATALLTTFVGYQIFASTWYGTFGDYSSAFIWGFFGQFGLQRIRDATKTITSKTL